MGVCYDKTSSPGFELNDLKRRLSVFCLTLGPTRGTDGELNPQNTTTNLCLLYYQYVTDHPQFVSWVLLILNLWNHKEVKCFKVQKNKDPFELLTSWVCLHTWLLHHFSLLCSVMKMSWQLRWVVFLLNKELNRIIPRRWCDEQHLGKHVFMGHFCDWWNDTWKISNIHHTPANFSPVSFPIYLFI